MVITSRQCRDPGAPTPSSRSSYAVIMDAVMQKSPSRNHVDLVKTLPNRFDPEKIRRNSLDPSSCRRNHEDVR